MVVSRNPPFSSLTCCWLAVGGLCTCVLVCYSANGQLQRKSHSGIVLAVNGWPFWTGL